MDPEAQPKNATAALWVLFAMLIIGLAVGLLVK